jgi:hypothetical protein
MTSPCRRWDVETAACLSAGRDAWRDSFWCRIFVPDDWASGLGELNANLASAAGHQGQFRQRAVRARRQHPETRHRMAGLFAVGTLETL